MAGSPPAPLAVTMGEPAGIGPDLILKIHAERTALGIPVFAVYGDADILTARARRLGLSTSVRTIAHPGDAASVFADALPVIACADHKLADTPGTLSDATGATVIAAITRATADVRSGVARALVTAPIHKAALKRVAFAYPGHTEFLAALCADETGRLPLPVMMLAHDDYRVVPLTIHEPLSRVPSLITPELIDATARVILRDLETRFGIVRPRLAVTGLNPHAGEDGTIGTEERDIIAPAIAALREDGFEVAGPFSADTLFHPPHWRAWDAVLAMYHDQALIPIKTVAFESGVNVTLGLPIVRTSPDHGTALGLAGTGQASTASMLAALRLADRLS